MSVKNEAISVLIVDDHQFVREGIKSNLSSDDRISTVYEAENARDAVHQASQHHPDVIIMDISLPDFNGMEATRLILDDNPQALVLGLTMHTQKEYVLGMMKAGAKGFLTKTCSCKNLLNAIQNVISDQVFICDEVQGALISAAIDPQADPNAEPGALTVRESQIIGLIADGKTNRETSQILNISIRTVEKHRKNLMDKLGIRTVAELTKYALKNGLTALD